MNSTAYREASKALLGHSFRLEVAVAVARSRSGVVYARQLADQLVISDQRVRENLARFESVGLLELASEASGRRPKTYRRRPSVYWRLCAELDRELRSSR